jgi:hypothetical protein
MKDVENTYNLLQRRIKANKEEMDREHETIQLVPAEEGQTIITSDVPNRPHQTAPWTNVQWEWI